MNNNETITRKCKGCKLSYTTPSDWDQQYNHELNGFCSYGCEARVIDRLNAYDRWAKP